MFDDTLLDSSPSNAPVLTGTHWLIGLAVWRHRFSGGLFLCPSLGAETAAAQAVQAGVLGGLLMLYAVMLCYVYADAKHLGFNTWVWFAIALLLNVVGFVFYLIYSAAKTGDWKRATIPIAYIVECVLMGVAILIPLVYTQMRCRRRC